MFESAGIRFSGWTLRGIATMAAVAVLCGVPIDRVEAADSNDTTSNSGVQECIDAWDDAPASSYCTDTAIARATSGSGWGNCVIDVSTCSITADSGATSTTYTPSWPTAYGSTGDGLPPSDVDDIDICFASSSSGGYTATVKTGCASTETDSATATSDGLNE